jgi:hypothetical protein
VNEPQGWVIYMVVGFSSAQGYRFELIDPRASLLPPPMVDPFFDFDTKNIIDNIGTHTVKRNMRSNRDLQIATVLRFAF